MSTGQWVALGGLLFALVVVIPGAGWAYRADLRRLEERRRALERATGIDSRRAEEGKIDD